MKPCQAKEIRFNYGGTEFRLISKSILSRHKCPNIFLKLKNDGTVKLYSYLKSIRGDIDEILYLEKPNGVLKEMEWSDYLVFWKRMKEYFADCLPLVEKLDNKEFKLWDVGGIVSYYNSECN